ncbi:MAG TPA: sulfotransferase domain-containing protein [Rhizomicrobium sp.]|nr:sulfotransferase domain-containing protein [Rhizomicrobium sp.]
MTDIVWLASYPKSGNTWLRILIGSLLAAADTEVDINELPEWGRMAGARLPFDNTLLIDSGLLSHDEIDCLRPHLYEELARGEPLEERSAPPARFSKVHDAYGLTPLGEPLLAGARGAKGAIVIVRDPRDVAPSLANHNRTSVDEAIAFLNDTDAALCRTADRLHVQLRQKVAGWSGHVASWLEQRDIPVHLVRYEDLQRDTAGVLIAAMAFAGVPVTPDDVARAVAQGDFQRLQAQEREAGFSEWQDRDGKGRLFFRRGEAGGWRDELSPEQVARLETAHAPMMRRLGYELSRGA